MSRNRNVYIEPAYPEKTSIGDEDLWWLLSNAFYNEWSFGSGRLDGILTKDDIPTLRLLIRTQPGPTDTPLKESLRALVVAIETRGPQKLSDD